MVEKVQARLHLHGYTIYDLAMVFEVARRENQTRRIECEKKNVDPTSDVWLKTWCMSGAPRMAWERGMSVRQANVSLARIEHDGLIEAKQRGKTTPPLRRVNVEALQMLQRAGDSRALFERVKVDDAFTLGPLDWAKDYFQDADMSDANRLTGDQVALLYDRPEKDYFFSTFWRDKFFAANKKLHPDFTFTRGSDKPSWVKFSAKATPFVLISHPCATRPLHIHGQPEAAVELDKQDDEQEADCAISS
jgi:hypothetical protein